MADKKCYEILHKPQRAAAWRHCRYLRGREAAEKYAEQIRQKWGGETRVRDAFLAQAKYIRLSPQKARLVVDLIRNRGAQEALNILRFTNKRATKEIAKVLRAALANAEQKAENVDVDRLYVSNAYVDQGPRWKRIRPAPMGRAFRYLRRLSHITIAVAERESA